MTRPLLGCVADDLTGTTDLAGSLVREGLRVTLVVGWWSGSAAGPTDR